MVQGDLAAEAGLVRKLRTFLVSVDCECRAHPDELELEDRCTSCKLERMLARECPLWNLPLQAEPDRPGHLEVPLLRLECLWCQATYHRREEAVAHLERCPGHPLAVAIRELETIRRMGLGSGQRAARTAEQALVVIRSMQPPAGKGGAS